MPMRTTMPMMEMTFKVWPGRGRAVVGRQAKSRDGLVDGRRDLAELSPPQVRRHQDLALLVLAADLARPADDFVRDEVPEGDDLALEGQGFAEQGLDVLARGVLQADKDVVLLLHLPELGGHPAAHGADQEIADRRGREAGVSLEGLLVDRDLELGLALADARGQVGDAGGRRARA